MKLETKFKPLDTIFYLEKDSKCSSNKVIKKGRIGSVKAIATGEHDIQIIYVLYDKTEINEVWCYSSLEELRQELLHKINGLGVGSVIGGI